MVAARRIVLGRKRTQARGIKLGRRARVHHSGFNLTTIRHKYKTTLDALKSK